MYKICNEHVLFFERRWRANFLLNVQSLRGKTQSLENLLRKYKDLKPALIPQVKITSRSTILIENLYSFLHNLVIHLSPAIPRH